LRGKKGSIAKAESREFTSNTYIISEVSNMIGSEAKILRLLFGAILLLGLGTIVFGQFGSGIQGTVTDQNGGIVPGATVRLTNMETNISIEVTTNENGLYRFNSLTQGNYSVLVTQSGFKKKLVERFVVNAESIMGLDIVLETGEVTAQVTVDGSEAAVLETETPNLGKNISNKEILMLPQVGRDPYQLARLAPGVFGDGARSANGAASRIGNNGTGPGGSSNGIFAVENQTQISANGQRVTSNNYEIDGVSVNSQTWGGAAVITPSQESISEVQVTSSTYSAEDGRNSGAQVKVISKYGTNDWHGSAFLKINDPSLNAYNSYRGVPGVSGLINLSPTRVADKFKTYGGSFGGPIVKDKLFFFAAYEGTRNSTAGVSSPTFVETASFRQGILSQRAGTLTAKYFASGFLPRVVEVLTPSCSNLSAPYNNSIAGFTGCQVVGNGLDIGSITGTYGTYVPATSTTATADRGMIGGGLDGIADLQYVTLENFNSFAGNQYTARIDYQLSPADKLTFTSNFTPLSAFSYNTDTQSREQGDLNSDRLTYLIGGIYARTISPTMLNEFRFNMTNWSFNEIDSNPDANWGLPRIEIESTFNNRLRWGARRAETTPGFFSQRTFDFRDTLTKISGNHTLKFGVQYRKEINTSGSPGGARPLFTFRNIWNFANGAPLFEAINADATGTPKANDVPFNTANIGVFVQDNWKFRPNLTLNLGLRWEYFQPITAGNDGVLGRLVLGTLGLVDSKIETTKQFTDKDLNNFAPQLGFAWNPRMFGGKAVLRGGAGIGYDRLASALFSNVRFAPPNAARFTINNGRFDNPFNTVLNATNNSGIIQFVESTDGTIYGYPQNTSIGGGFGANGGPRFGQVEIYSSPKDLPNAFVYRYSMEVQYELPLQMVATVGYQGSLGKRFVRILPLHQIYASSSSPTFRLVYFASPDVNTSYNAALVSLRKRYSKGFDLNVNYKFSKGLDTVSVEAPCGCTNQTYTYDNGTEKGPSDFDVTHYLNISGTWEPQWFKGQNNAAGDLLSGWSFSPIITWRGGFPWTPTVGATLRASADTTAISVIRPVAYYGTAPLANTNENFLTTGLFPQNLILNAAGTASVACNTPATVPAGCSRYFLTTTNGTIPQNNPPGIGRNVFRGPRYFSTDLSIAKNIKLPSVGFLGEAANINLRFNFFNLFNTLNLAPFTAGSNSTRVDNVQFGVATGALAGRVGEFQIRFSF
jgi:hypothetical protein